jgi:flagellar hook-length control protein FliK
MTAPLPDAPSPQSVGGAPTPAAPSASKPARTLTIQLHPADLGMLHVELHVRDGALSVKVRPSQDETVRLLEKDRQALTEMLSSAGHEVEALTIQALPREAAPLAPDLQSASQRGQAQGSAEGERQPGGEGRSQGQPDHRRNHLHQGHENAKSAGERGSGRDLYV